jgi:predicted N-acetyltransferase YhbS
VIAIRPEQPDDEAAVSAVHTEAFGRPAEARIVERLRQAAGPYLGLVATDGGPIVGHILFTPVTLRGENPRFGFVPAHPHPLGLSSEPAMPTAAFMVAELTPGALRGRRGVIVYGSDFS